MINLINEFVDPHNNGSDCFIRVYYHEAVISVEILAYVP